MSAPWIDRIRRLSRRQRAAALAMAGAAIVAANAVLLPPRYAPRVKLETVRREPLALIVRAAGQLEARASVTLKAQFDGPVQVKRFQEGQAVEKDQVLAVIGRDQIRLDYQARRDALANAEADLSRARRELRLQQSLFKRQAVAYNSVEDARRALVRAQQGLRGAQEALRMEQQRWDSASVVAPFAGTVVRDGLGDDKQVAAGREIATVADISEYQVRARVDELDSKALKIGQPADVRLQIYPDVWLKARLTQIGSAADNAATQEILAVMKLEGDSGLALRPRLTAEARIRTGQTEPVLTVPLGALVNADGQARVWRLGAFGRLRAQSVSLGRSNPDRVEVTKGLVPGQRICAESGHDLDEGMAVRIRREGEAAPEPRPRRRPPPGPLRRPGRL